MKLKGNQISALFMAMLVVSMFAVAPAMACEPRTPCGDKTIVGDPVELTGEEREVVLDNALKNEGIIKLKQDLEKDGFKQKNIETHSVKITAEDGSSVNLQVATLKFESVDGTTKELNYLYNEQTGETIVLSGPLSCVLCLGAIVFGGSTCAAVCVVSGAISMGVTCVACILLAGGIALCPCYDCACAAGFDEACDMSDQLC